MKRLFSNLLFYYVTFYFCMNFQVYSFNEVNDIHKIILFFPLGLIRSNKIELYQYTLLIYIFLLKSKYLNWERTIYNLICKLLFESKNSDKLMASSFLRIVFHRTYAFWKVLTLCWRMYLKSGSLYAGCPFVMT